MTCVTSFVTFHVSHECHMSRVTCHVSCVTCHMLCVTCHVSCITCHMSHVMCHMSCVMCHMSHVMCHMSCVTFLHAMATLLAVLGDPCHMYMSHVHVTCMCVRTFSDDLPFVKVAKSLTSLLTRMMHGKGRGELNSPVGIPVVW